MSTPETTEILIAKVPGCDVTIPTRATEGSAGFDLYAMYDVDIKPGDKKKLFSGIQIDLPPNFCAYIWGRSGLYMRNLEIFNGLLDSDFKDELIIVAKNTGKNLISIKKGDRFAQLIITRCPSVVLKEINAIPSPSSASRFGGFGSTGQ